MPRARALRSTAKESTTRVIRRSTRKSARARRTARRISFGSVSEDETHNVYAEATTATESSDYDNVTSRATTPKSPAQLDAEKDAAVYIQDSCFSHSLGDAPEPFHYQPHKSHHGHSHGSSSGHSHTAAPVPVVVKKPSQLEATNNNNNNTNTNGGVNLKDTTLVLLLFLVSVLTSIASPFVIEYVSGPPDPIPLLTKAELSVLVEEYITTHSLGVINGVVESKTSVLQTILEQPSATDLELQLSLEELTQAQQVDVNNLADFSQQQQLTNDNTNTVTAALSTHQGQIDVSLQGLVDTDVTLEEKIAALRNQVDKEAKRQQLTNDNTNTVTAALNTHQGQIDVSLQGLVDTDVNLEEKIAALRTEHAAHVVQLKTQADSIVTSSQVTEQSQAQLQAQLQALEEKLNADIAMLSATVSDLSDGRIDSNPPANQPGAPDAGSAVVLQLQKRMKELSTQVDDVKSSTLTESGVQQLMVAYSEDVTTHLITTAIANSNKDQLTEAAVQELIIAASSASDEVIKNLIATAIMESKKDQLTEAAVKQLIEEAVEGFSTVPKSTVTADAVQELITAATTEINNNIANSKYVEELWYEADQAKRRESLLATFTTNVEVQYEYKLAEAVKAAMEKVQVYIQEELAQRGTTNVQKVVDDALATYHADGTGQADYALAFTHGDIIEASETFSSQDEPQELGLLDLWVPAAYEELPGPQTMLQNDMTPGKCWPMKGAQGWALIQLREAITVTGISVEHIAPQQSPNKAIYAPKIVRFYGHADAQAMQTALAAAYEGANSIAEAVPIGDFLGEFEYALDDSVKRIQGVKDLAAVTATQSYEFVTFEVVSNHDTKPESPCTCIYRVRVHGEPIVLD